MNRDNNLLLLSWLEFSFVDQSPGRTDLNTSGAELAP